MDIQTCNCNECIKHDVCKFTNTQAAIADQINEMLKDSEICTTTVHDAFKIKMVCNHYRTNTGLTVKDM